MTAHAPSTPIRREPARLRGNPLSGALLLGLVSVFQPALGAECQRFACTIIGTDKSDYLEGTAGDDVICGLRGNDVIDGKGGRDLICGDAGHDTLFGGDGPDTLIGGSGEDRLFGGSGDDELDGNQGKDWLDGQAGDDFLVGGLGKDSLDGGQGNDLCTGDRPDALQDCSAPDNSQPTAETQFFSMQGREIYDPQGASFVPRGVNIFPWHRAPATVDAIADCWQFNLVRLHSWIFPRDTEQWKDHLVYIDEPVTFDPRQTTYTTYDVRGLIDYYTSREVVVLFDVHEHTGRSFEGRDLEDYLVFIRDFAHKFKDNPYVWLDIHNEPGSYEGQASDYASWRHEVQTILDTVKAIAPHMVTLVSGMAWGQDTGPSWSNRLVEPAQSALLSNADLITQYDNVIATFHVYDQWTFGTERLQDYVEQLYRTLSRPVLVGEYGSFNNVDTSPASESLHVLAGQDGYQSLGRVVWTWDADDRNDLTTTASGGGQHVDSCAAPGNLSPLGQLVWDDNHPRDEMR